MSRLQIVLSIMGGFIVLVIGAGVVAWKLKGEAWAAQLREAGTKEIADAEKVGAGATKDECVQLGLARMRQDSGLMGQVKVGIFMEHCLDAAKGDLSFCVDAPPEDEIMKTVNWRLKVSEALGLTNSENGVVKGIQKHCVK